MHTTVPVRRSTRRVAVRRVEEGHGRTAADSSRTGWRPGGWARRHGPITAALRLLLSAVARDVVEGTVGLAEANRFLTGLGCDPLHGPTRVTFLVPVAQAMIHEDAATDIGELRAGLDQAQRFMRWTRLGGYPRGFRLTRPSTADLYTARRHTVASTVVRVEVTVPGHHRGQRPDTVAAALLAEDLGHLHGRDIEVLADPQAWPDAPHTADPHPQPDVDQGGGWPYIPVDLPDDGDYLNYGLDDGDPDPPRWDLRDPWAGPAPSPYALAGEDLVDLVESRRP